jgi:heme oxygenase
LGAAYVLEGSRLGACLLLQTLHLPGATRFLRHGQGKGLWPRFLSVLETSDEVREHFDQTMTAALEVFGLFIHAMSSVTRGWALDAAE